MNYINKLILLVILGSLYYGHNVIEEKNEILMMRTEVLISPFSNGSANGDSPIDKLIRRYKCDFWIYQKEAIATQREIMPIVAEAFNHRIDEKKILYLESLSKVVSEELDHCELISKIKAGRMILEREK
jgi:hypothetical protein